MSIHPLEVGKKVIIPLDDGSVFSVGLTDKRHKHFSLYSSSPHHIWISQIYDILGCLTKLGHESPSNIQTLSMGVRPSNWTVDKARSFDLESFMKSQRDTGGLVGLRFVGVWDADVVFCAERMIYHPDDRIQEILDTGSGVRCTMIEFDGEGVDFGLEAFPLAHFDEIVGIKVLAKPSGHSLDERKLPFS